MMHTTEPIKKMGGRQKASLIGLALFCVLLTVLFFAPAVWFDVLLQKQTKGQFALADIEGSLWNGSGVITVSDHNNNLIPLLPGRFHWELSPAVLVGQIELSIENDEVLQQPLYISGNFRHLQLNPDTLVLPADRLASLGAPLNTVQPAGEVLLSWDTLWITLSDKTIDMSGSIKLAMNDMSSALSPIKPLGTYMMDVVWRGQEADIVLETMKGPMLLSGKGRIIKGRLHFTGLAQAEIGREEDLIGLLNLLGRPRPDIGKYVIGLEVR